jgi:nuclear pore complex protein Nup133
MLPNVSLIPYGSSREPGLVMISSTGEIRLWESINAGLAGADQFYSSSAPLSAGEYISNMYRCEVSSLVLHVLQNLIFGITRRHSTSLRRPLADCFAWSYPLLAANLMLPSLLSLNTKACYRFLAFLADLQT